MQTRSQIARIWGCFLSICGFASVRKMRRLATDPQARGLVELAPERRTCTEEWHRTSGLSEWWCFFYDDDTIETLTVWRSSACVKPDNTATKSTANGAA